MDKHRQLIAKTERSEEEEQESVTLVRELKSKRVAESVISSLDYKQYESVSDELERLKHENDSDSESSSKPHD